MTDCRDVLEHLSEYLDEELPPGEFERIAAHLSECGECVEAKERLLSSIEVCRSFHTGENPGELPEPVKAELRAAYLRVRSGMSARENA